MRKIFHKKDLYIYIFVIIMCIMALFSTNYIYKNGFNGPPIRSDGKGYYVYLPSFFIDHSYNIQMDENTPYWYTLDNGKVVDVYPMGTAILQIPFFLLAHFYTLLSDPSMADGWSGAYQFCNILSAVFYYSLGILFLHKLLKQYFSDKISFISCILISIGTNLFNYVTHDASYSHIYSFSIFTIFLYHLVSYEEYKKKIKGGGINEIINLMLFGFLAGIIFMIRNTNIIFILLYIFYSVNDARSLKNRLFEIVKPERSLPIIAAGIITISPQLIYWKKISGHFLFVSYPGDHLFDWFTPHIFNVLFSIRKGALFWCPLLIFAVWGMGIKNKKLKEIHIAGIIFIVVNLYIISSWNCWPYGGSLGQRPFIDSYGLIAVYLANFLEMLSYKIEHHMIAKIVAFLLFLLIIIWSLCITWGYWVHLIPYDGATWDTVKQFVKQIVNLIKEFVVILGIH